MTEILESFEDDLALTDLAAGSAINNIAVDDLIDIDDLGEASAINIESLTSTLTLSDSGDINDPALNWSTDQQLNVSDCLTELDDLIGTYDEAAIYFANQLKADAWEKASIKQRIAALLEASITVRLLQLSEDYTLATVPKYFRYGVYEQALSLLAGKNIEQSIKASQIIRDKWSSVESEYQSGDIPLSLAAGILSAKAWSYLQPYLANMTEINLVRVN